jgi:hypothetical protein
LLQSIIDEGGIINGINIHVLRLQLLIKNIDTKFRDIRIILQYHVPCVVYGSCEQYLKVCQRFCELIDLPQCIVNIDDKPHTSDMIMLANGFSTNDVNKLKYVADYPNTGLLIHCSFNYCTQNKKDKLGAMFEIWNNQQHCNKNTNE